MSLLDHFNWHYNGTFGELSTTRVVFPMFDCKTKEDGIRMLIQELQKALGDRCCEQASRGSHCDCTPCWMCENT